LEETKDIFVKKMLLKSKKKEKLFDGGCASFIFRCCVFFFPSKKIKLFKANQK